MTDPVARLTPLALMVLALLREGDMHPYEMIRLMRMRHDDRLVPVTNGTVYHTVGRLQRAGLVAEVGVDRAGNRPERTTYTLTDAGAAAVPAWVRGELVPIDHPAQFRVALAEAHNLERAEVVALLERRLAALRDAHTELTTGQGRARAKGVPEQYLLEVERDEVLLAAETSWLASLLVRIRDDEFPWGVGGAPSARYLAQREAARQ